jgi:Flp pilus assembly protein TadD
MKAILAAAALILLPGIALANADAGPVAQADPVLENARAAFARKDWPAAQAGLRSAVATDPKNAEYHNLYAYSLRKGSSPDMSLVFKHYNQALALDPKHKGAHEYIGEAYLMVKNVAKAKEHLAQLDKLCLFSCQEYRDLKAAIAAYEKSAPGR